jgi:CubicO group peptidase (beta-lactamase class C family)
VPNLLRRALLTVAVGALGFANAGCLVARIVYFNSPDLEFNDDFKRRGVAPAAEAKPLASVEPPARFDPDLDTRLEENETRAFLVVKDDRVIYERYFGGTTARSLLPSFSISKTFAALLVGCAIEDGLLASTDESIVALLPELAKKPRYGAVTIDELLRMTSGIDFEEESVDGALFYYAPDLRRRIFDYDIKWAPGTHYEYGSLSTQILGEAIHRKLGGRTVASYFQERVWQRLGAEARAMWSIDSDEDGAEKLAAGFAATARDHARLGLVYLHGGELDGREVVPRAWVESSLETDDVTGVVRTSDGEVRRARYQWFETLDKRAYFAKGYNGQYVFVIPEKKMVFVRFGDGYGDIDWPHLFMRLSEAG